MTDLALTITAESIAAGVVGADLSIVNNDFLSDDGLETAVHLSLFLDARAHDDDELPPGQTDRRGWFGDALSPIDGDSTGSRLWLLAREKVTQQIPTRAREYAAEALAWLTLRKVADRVEIATEITAPGMLGIGVDIFRPNRDPVHFQYSYTWAAQAAKRG